MDTVPKINSRLIKLLDLFELNEIVSRDLFQGTVFHLAFFIRQVLGVPVPMSRGDFTKVGRIS